MGLGILCDSKALNGPLSKLEKTNIFLLIFYSLIYFFNSQSSFREGPAVSYIRHIRWEGSKKKDKILPFIKNRLKKNVDPN